MTSFQPSIVKKAPEGSLVDDTQHTHACVQYCKIFPACRCGVGLPSIVSSWVSCVAHPYLTCPYKWAENDRVAWGQCSTERPPTAGVMGDTAAATPAATPAADACMARSCNCNGNCSRKNEMCIPLHHPKTGMAQSCMHMYRHDIACALDLDV